jgi:hypothetical protein
MEPGKKPTESRGRLPLLLGLAVVLAGIYAWDRWADGSAETAPPRPGAGSPGAAGPDKADALTAAGPGAEADPGSEPQEAHALASLALNELHDTVRRPLFEKTRRPVEPPPPARPTVAQPVIPAPPRGADPNALTLLGVLMSEGGGAIALLRRNQTGQNVRLQEGNTVDGWTVERIEPARVLLRQGDTRIALELFRKR